MDLEQLPDVAKYILMGLGSLVILTQIVVTMTPSKADDEAWDKIKAWPFVGPVLSWLASKAPIQKK